MPLQRRVGAPAESSASVCVIGGGVVGVTSAYFLARAGYKVTVLEAGPAPATVTSYANAGVIRANKTTALASPSSVRQMATAVYQRVASWFTEQEVTPTPFIVSPWAFTDLEFLRWGATFARCCLFGYGARADFLNVFGRFSVHALHETIQHEGLASACDYRRTGSVVAYGDAEELAVLRSKPEYELLSRAQLIQREPSLASVAHKFAGATFERNDAVGDCYRFTQALATVCNRDWDVTFRFNSSVTGFQLEHGRAVAAVTSDDTQVKADHFVVAVGPRVQPFMKASTGVHVPVYPIRGYSLTVPVRDSASDGALGMSEAPNRLTISHDSFVHAARFSDRVRYVTVAQVQPRRAANAPDPAGVETLAESALYMWPHLKNRVFRGDGSYIMGTLWSGQRPVSADGVPIVCRASPTLSNVWLNAGHGSMGFKFSCGTAQMLAWLLQKEDGSQGEASSADPVNAMAWRSQMLAYAPFLELQRFGRWKVQRFSGARASNGTR